MRDVNKNMEKKQHKRKFLIADGSAFMQMLAEFYRQNRYDEKIAKTEPKHSEVSDKVSKTEEKHEESLLARNLY